MAELIQRPTLVMLLRPVQITLQQLAQLFPAILQRTLAKTSIELGVYMSFQGLRICLPHGLYICRCRSV